MEFRLGILNFWNIVILTKGHKFISVLHYLVFTLINKGFITIIIIIIIIIINSYRYQISSLWLNLTTLY